MTLVTDLLLTQTHKYYKFNVNLSRYIYISAFFNNHYINLLFDFKHLNK